MLIAIAAIAVLAAVFGLLLGYSAIRFHIDGDPIADQVDALLPQSQCGQCGYPGCRPYAEAVAAGEAEINLCSPGGEAPCWPWRSTRPRAGGGWASGGEAQVCRGHRRADLHRLHQVPAGCPVDAIVGAAKQLHGIIASECTGCELCRTPARWIASAWSRFRSPSAPGSGPIPQPADAWAYRSAGTVAARRQASPEIEHREAA
jgi:electron transport complex protein RnfB